MRLDMVDGRRDVVVLDKVGSGAPCSPMPYGIGATFNLARYLSLDPRSRDFYREMGDRCP